MYISYSGNNLFVESHTKSREIFDANDWMMMISSFFFQFQGERADGAPKHEKIFMCR